MKLVLLVCGFLFSTQAMAFGFGSNKWASDQVVQKALSNPHLYRIDDGGNINFGNGIYKRRFSFTGKPQACYEGNFLYAGTAPKCVKPIYQQNEQVGCKVSKIVQLKTQMKGTYQVCTDHDDDESGCSKYSTVKFSKGPRVKVAIYRKNGMSKNDPLAGFLGFAYLMLPRCS